MNLRKLLFIVICIHCLSCFSQSIDKESAKALEHIQKGYVAYGIEELQKASSQNALAAQYYLAKCYANNICLGKDYEKAVLLYRRAAERGLPDAMFYLSSCYKEGKGVTANTIRSNEWEQRFLRKGGTMVLPDICVIYNEGVSKYPENYYSNPSDNCTTEENSASNKITSQNTFVNKVTIIQQVAETSTTGNKETSTHKSDIDINIPTNPQNNFNTFVLVIANENYKKVSRVPFAGYDGKTFEQYCIKTLGIPQTNIHTLTDATLNDMRHEIKWMQDIMSVYKGEAKVIFYYAGHGIPDEQSKNAYLLPIDGYGSDVTTGYSLANMYRILGEMPSKLITIFLDACFSGGTRNGNMLTSARGVAIKVKTNSPTGNMVVFTAAQGDETAYPYKERSHGLFTYYLLKKLQETKGNVTLGELGDYIQTQVKRQSVVTNGKLQSPAILTAPKLGNNWKNWKLK